MEQEKTDIEQSPDLIPELPDVKLISLESIAAKTKGKGVLLSGGSHGLVMKFPWEENEYRVLKLEEKSLSEKDIELVTSLCSESDESSSYLKGLTPDKSFDDNEWMINIKQAKVVSEAVALMKPFSEGLVLTPKVFSLIHSGGKIVGMIQEFLDGDWFDGYTVLRDKQFMEKAERLLSLGLQIDFASIAINFVRLKNGQVRFVDLQIKLEDWEEIEKMYERFKQSFHQKLG